MPGDYPMEPEARTEGTITSGTTHGQWETIAPPCLLPIANERTLNPFQLADLLRGKAERAAGTRAWSESAEKLLRFAAQQVDALGMERDAATRRAAEAEAEADRDLWRQRAEAGRRALFAVARRGPGELRIVPCREDVNGEWIADESLSDRFSKVEVVAIARAANVDPALLTWEPEEATPDDNAS